MKPVSSAAAAALLGILLAGSLALANPPTDWRAHVPQKDRAMPDPLPSTPDNAAAGQNLYRHDCAGCHGRTAEGRGHHPSLRTYSVRSATDGELAWLLRNGSLGHGMPSWSRLPEAQRWQIIQYLRTLPDPAASQPPLR